MIIIAIISEHIHCSIHLHLHISTSPPAPAGWGGWLEVQVVLVVAGERRREW
jgi:hypothetical protein